MDKERKPISRIDHKGTHGYFARIYRAEWVGSRSFADGQYDGSASALAAARWWVEYAENRLPIIHPKPALKKATAHVRTDAKGSGLRYYDVYLPSAVDDSWTTQKFYFKTLDEQSISREKATMDVNYQNKLLAMAYREQLAAWYVEHDRIMLVIVLLWNDIKTMEILFPPAPDRRDKITR
jgi:hypothetical protein